MQHETLLDQTNIFYQLTNHRDYPHHFLHKYFILHLKNENCINYAKSTLQLLLPQIIFKQKSLRPIPPAP